MRINRFIAASTGRSRRGADTVIAAGQVLVNGQSVDTGYDVQPDDVVTMNGERLIPLAKQTILLHKPVGFVTSRDGQGSRTIYELLPPELHQLKPVGRLDKDSSGLLLLTNDGDLAHTLTHPSHQKMKCYEIALDRPLTSAHRELITKQGVQLDDGLSRLKLDWLHKNDDLRWRITMHEGRNRQIRRTFALLGYIVKRLHRTHFGSYTLDHLKPGEYRQLTDLPYTQADTSSPKVTQQQA